ncbi:MAG: patatin-like phospholipase family protein [Gammaproteobacteria bacterium]|nr:patatin-like phospholipase family protein [Gammaproteobacteria bacterium]
MDHDCDTRPGHCATLRVAALSVSLALLASGCAFFVPDKIHHVVNPAEQPAARCDLDDNAEPAERILGIALSGGGSRAAVFGAAALEALSEHGVLEQLSHLSSVSGGSLAASYFMANPPGCEETATTQAEQACWHEYFSDFKTQMRVNYQYGIVTHNARPTRFTSPTRRVTSLQEELDKRFLHGKTFGELGPHPVVLINATSYDETRRFVFSNACLAEGAAESSAASGQDGGKRYRIMAENALAQRALQAFTFSRPHCMRPVPNDLPVSLAVAASASFPPAIGPVSIEVPSDCDAGEPEWWHLGDGGAIENSGVDSLEEVLLRRLADPGPPLQKALILSVDAGKKMDPAELKARKNFRMNSSPSRANLVVISPRVRGQAYHDVFWDEMIAELASEGIGFEKITFKHGLAQLARLPDSCSGKMSVEEVISDLLSEIPTRFTVDDCNADLLEMAAHQLVHESLDDATVQRLTGEGFAIHASRGCRLRQ